MLESQSNSRVAVVDTRTPGCEYSHKVCLFFSQIYSVPEEDDVLLTNFSFTTPSTMLVSQSNGRVAVVDTRTPG